MTIQLPDNFVIADVRIEERNVREEDVWRLPVVNRIAMPVEPSVAQALNVAVAEEIVTALQQAVGAVRGVLTGIRPLSEHALAQCRRRRRIQCETSAARGDPCRERPVHSGPVALGDRVGAAVEGRLCEQSANVATAPSWCTRARTGPLHDAMQRLACAPLPFVTRHLAKPVET